MAFSSFYGGRRGQSFVFNKIFNNISQLENNTAKQIFIGQYVLISSNENDPHNGEIYRKISNSEEALQAWSLIGKISGPPGPSPLTEIVSYNENLFDGKTEGYDEETIDNVNTKYYYSEGSFLAANNGTQEDITYIPGKPKIYDNLSDIEKNALKTIAQESLTEQETEGLSEDELQVVIINKAKEILMQQQKLQTQQIHYKMLSSFFVNGEGENSERIAKNQIGLKIPYFIPTPTIDNNTINNFNDPVAVNEEYDSNFPLNPTWIFSIPKGKPGDYITNIRIEKFNSDESEIEYKYFNKNNILKEIQYYEGNKVGDAYFNLNQDNDSITYEDNQDIKKGSLILICDYIIFSTGEQGKPRNTFSSQPLFLGIFTSVKEINLDNDKLTFELTDGETKDVTLRYPTDIKITNDENNITGEGKKLVIKYSNESQYLSLGTISNAGGLLASFSLIATTSEEDGKKILTYSNNNRTSIFSENNPLTVYLYNNDEIVYNTNGNPQYDDAKMINNNNGILKDFEDQFNSNDENAKELTIENIINFFNNEKIVIRKATNGYYGQMIAIQIIKRYEENTSEQNNEENEEEEDQLIYTYCCAYDDFAKKWINLGSFSSKGIMSGGSNTMLTAIQTNLKNDQNIYNLHDYGGIILFTEKEFENDSDNKKITYNIQDNDVIKIQGKNKYEDLNETISFLCKNSNKKMTIMIVYKQYLNNESQNPQGSIIMDDNEIYYQINPILPPPYVNSNSVSFENGILSFVLNTNSTSQEFLITVTTSEKSQYFIAGNHPEIESPINVDYFDENDYNYYQEEDQDISGQPENTNDEPIDSGQQEEELPSAPDSIEDPENEG